ncbi:MAG: outer membrane beta-barrel family protein [Sediminibacterium sp.]|nr:outer membrane beta-barrel family protein [Sediminibacterium sp.]
MKSYSIIFTLLISAIHLIGQTKVSGVVRDSLGSGLPYATMALVKLPDSAIVRGTVTDSLGNYSINATNPGTYFIRCFSIGYRNGISPVFMVDSADKKNLVFDLVMNMESTSLEQLTVVGLRKLIEVKNGNTVVNVENSVLAKGNSLYELLVKLPGITIDENKIMMQGKTGVIVMIDDRPQKLSGSSLINLLKGMNADLVKSIEILKNPPVKYDATGTSGMINIKTKKAVVTGLTGSLFSSYSQGFYDRSLLGGALNYKTRKALFFTTLSLDKSRYRSEQSFEKNFTDLNGSSSLNTKNVTNDLNRTLNYTIGFDYALSPTDVLGAKVEGNAGLRNTLSNSVNSITGYNTFPFNKVYTDIDQNGDWKSTNVNVNYEHKLDTLGSQWVCVADYTDLPEAISESNLNSFFNAADVQASMPNNYKNTNGTGSSVISGRSDLVKVINRVGTFETGLKFVMITTANNYLFKRDILGDGNYVEDVKISNKYNYEEKTYAAYGNYIKTIGNLSMQLGARLEKTSLNGSSERNNYVLKKDYFQLFPNVSFAYQYKDDHEFQLNVLRRTNRPNFADLNPFMFFLDQYSFQIGNPLLLPDFNTRGELTYSFRGAFSFAVAYSSTQNVMLQYLSQTDSSRTIIQSVKNMKSNNAVESSAFYQGSINRRWDVVVTGSFSYMTYRGDIDNVSFYQTGINYFANLSNVFLLSEKMKLELNALYVGPNVYGIVKLKPKWMASMAVKMALFNDRMDMALGVDDVFYTFVNRVESKHLNQNWYSYKTNDTRRFRISLSYKFGKIKINERATRLSNEEEKERLNH